MGNSIEHCYYYKMEVCKKKNEKNKMRCDVGHNGYRSWGKWGQRQMRG